MNTRQRFPSYYPVLSPMTYMTKQKQKKGNATLQLKSIERQPDTPRRQLHKSIS